MEFDETFDLVISGLVTDGCARVIKSDGKPIPGLYTAGNIAAPVVGRCYAGAGASIGGGIAFGHIAACRAMQADEVGAAQAA